jgi:hypothetical protein
VNGLPVDVWDFTTFDRELAERFAPHADLTVA